MPHSYHGVSRSLRLALAKAKYNRAEDEIELAWLSFNNPEETDHIVDFYVRRHHHRMRDIRLEDLRLRLRQHDEIIDDIERSMYKDELYLFKKKEQDKKNFQEALARMKEKENAATNST